MGPTEVRHRIVADTLPALVAAAGDPADLAVLVDFDGTLSPIVDDPTRARPRPGAIAALDRLAGSIGRVGVISGRPISFLADHLPDTVALSGLYGLETLVDGVRHDHEQSGCWREVVADLGAHANAAGPDGMRVETKELSITLHYRERPELEHEVEVWAAEEAARSGLLARPARRSWELHPPIDVDKGSAVVDLAADAAAVCFIGDDHGDLPAFEALEAMAAEGRTTLKVAVDSPEASPELIERADVVVDGPEAVEALLDELDRLVRA